MTCEKKLQLVEIVDIAQLKPPIPKIINMAPLSKRNRPKTQVRISPNDSAVRTQGQQSQASPSVPTSGVQEELPDSPSVSEFSVLSTDTSNLSFRVASVAGQSNLAGEVGSENTKSNDKTITAKVELRRSGYLPGDVIPVRVTVRHNRPVRSMQGIILTLYRKARIEPHPLLTKGLSVTGAGKEPVSSIHTKSKLGIGGLSLSASSSHTFRMELDQNFAPMIINPNTLEAEIKAELRVPEDAFPTIACIPGNMVTFTYHVEVIVDLCAKLAMQGRIMSRMTMTRSPSSVVLGQTRNLHADLDANHFMDTLEVRRDKSIGNCTFDITIGTKDSDRKTVRRPLDPWEEAERAARQGPESPSEDHPSQMGTLQVEELPDENHDRSGTILQTLPESEVAGRPSTVVPPPEPEDNADEKTRLRRMEERLLPSAPTAEDYASSSALTARAQPSAPILDDEDEVYVPTTLIPAYERPPDFSSDTIVPSSSTGSQEIAAVADETASPSDDKQELERQRLLAAASSPDDAQGDVASGAGPSLAVPTAPVFDDDDDDDDGYYDASPHDTFTDNPLTSDSRGRWTESEHLPRYQH